MSAIDDVFAKCAAEGRAAFIPFLMAGDPDLEPPAQAARWRLDDEGYDRRADHRRAGEEKRRDGEVRWPRGGGAGHGLSLSFAGARSDRNNAPG